MHTNSQLIEAITQKLELSQQLEMWQVRGRISDLRYAGYFNSLK